MKINKYYIISIIYICCLGLIAKPAQAQLFKSKQIKRLERLITELKSNNDSLKQVLSKYKDSLKSLQNENDSLLLEDLDSNNISYTRSSQTIDSLINSWTDNKEENSILDENTNFSSNVADSIIIRRLAKINSPIYIPYNNIVRNFIIKYSEKMSKQMSSILALSEYYMPIFEEIFAKYNIPIELKYMAVIESALNPTAKSRAGACGLWQFMYGTAKKYGLEINSYVDERLDPVKSAEAAAKYLQESYDIFKDWNLAIASYNCGAGNVMKAIRRAGNKKDFWSVYNYLPRETRSYVPAFIGAMYAFHYQKELGLKKDADYDIPYQVDTFEINKNLHYQQIKELVGIPIEVLRDLNPQYIRDIVPGGNKSYTLIIPQKFSNNYIDQEDSLHLFKVEKYLGNKIVKEIRNRKSPTYSLTHKVRKGETLSHIAAKYRIRIKDIMKWNNLKSHRLRIGQKLFLHPKSVANSKNRALPFKKK